MATKPKTLRPIPPNAGVEAAYRRALRDLLAQVQADVLNELRPMYQRHGLATDASLPDSIRRMFGRLATGWRKKLDALGPEVAAIFAKGATSHTDKAMMAALRKAGFTVRFQFSERQQAAYQAVLGENVGLISSLALEQLHDIEQAVWRSVSAGHDLATLSSHLQHVHEMTRKRADLIARDQNAKAKASIEQARRLDLGITQAIWQHSTAGRHPRPSHVAASGKTYDIDKGMYLDGEWVLPGQAINCRCTSRAIIPGID